MHDVQSSSFLMNSGWLPGPRTPSSHVVMGSTGALPGPRWGRSVFFFFFFFFFFFVVVVVVGVVVGVVGVTLMWPC